MKQSASAAGANDQGQAVLGTPKAENVGGATKFNPGIHKANLLPPAMAAGPLVQGPGLGANPFKGTLETAYWNTDMKRPNSARYGFRFHYNPNQISISTYLDDSVVKNQLSWFQNVQLWAHEQTIQFSLILNRINDVAESSGRNFVPQVSVADLGNIKKYGTNYDIDFLYHAINGDTQVLENGETTSDLGFIYPTTLKLTLGPNWIRYGFVQTINIQHQQFTPSMVPVLTQVDIAMIRLSPTETVPVDAGAPKPEG